jgi:hypothetical protein
MVQNLRRKASDPQQGKRLRKVVQVFDGLVEMNTRLPAQDTRQIRQRAALVASAWIAADVAGLEDADERRDALLKTLYARARELGVDPAEANAGYKEGLTNPKLTH